jgi:Na+/H+-dicarboxylate symporter
MRQERITEEIKYRTEVFKVLSFYLITLAGGEIGLLLNLNNLIKVFLFFLGLPLILILGIAIWFQHSKILKLLKELEEEDRNV